MEWGTDEKDSVGNSTSRKEKIKDAEQLSKHGRFEDPTIKQIGATFRKSEGVLQYQDQ